MAPAQPGDRQTGAGALDLEESGGEYRLECTEADDREETSPATWVPTRGPSEPKRTRSAPRAAAPQPLDRSGRPLDWPGPFFTWSALVYPLVYPTWMRWLGLSVITGLAAAMVATTLFVISIIATFGAFASIFAIGGMAMGCLALVSYVIATFVMVVEQSANGEDRLSRLPDLSWWDVLPPFMSTLGAVATAAFVTCVVTLPLQHWFLPYELPLLAIRGLIAFKLFPILLIANLVDGSWLPFHTLGVTLGRLASCAGWFALFLLLALTGTVAAVAALVALLDCNLIAGLAALGPIAAAWLLYYGHWLGRLTRRLLAANE
jgi:hypothetical protein